MEGVGHDSSVDSDTVARPKACMCALNRERHAVQGDTACIWLCVDGPCRMQFVLVDDYRRGLGKNLRFISSKEAPAKVSASDNINGGSTGLRMSHFFSLTQTVAMSSYLIPAAGH